MAWRTDRIICHNPNETSIFKGGVEIEGDFTFGDVSSDTFTVTGKLDCNGNVDLGSGDDTINVGSGSGDTINIKDSATFDKELSGDDYCISFSNAPSSLDDGRDTTYIRWGKYNGGSTRAPIEIDAMDQNFAPVAMHFDIKNDGGSAASFRPIWLWTKITSNDQANTSVYGVMHYVDVNNTMSDAYGCLHQIVINDDATAREVHGVQGIVEIADTKTLTISGSAAASAVNGSIEGTGDLSAAGDLLYALQGSVEAAVGSTGTTGALYLYLAAACDHAIRVGVSNVTIGDGLMYVDDPNDKIYTDGAPTTLDGSLKIKVEHSGGTETKYIPLYNASS